jgi:hypothetical protein
MKAGGAPAINRHPADEYSPLGGVPFDIFPAVVLAPAVAL